MMRSKRQAIELQPDLVLVGGEVLPKGRVSEEFLVFSGNSDH